MYTSPSPFQTQTMVAELPYKAPMYLTIESNMGLNDFLKDSLTNGQL